MAGENLDISSGQDAAASNRAAGGRPFVGVRFACCEVYSRVYINRQATAYTGYCPRCLKKIELLIAPGGTDSRFFTAG
jgi:hypothetical protein